MSSICFLPSNTKELILSFYLKMLRQSEEQYTKRTRAFPPTIWPLVCSEFWELHHHHLNGKQLLFCVPLDFSAEKKEWSAFFAEHGIDAARLPPQKSLCLTPLCDLPRPEHLRLSNERVIDSQIHIENMGQLWVLRQCLEAMEPLGLLPFVHIIRLELFVPCSRLVYNPQPGGEEREGCFVHNNNEDEDGGALKLSLQMVQDKCVCNLREFHLRILQSTTRDDPWMNCYFKLKVLLPMYRSIIVRRMPFLAWAVSDMETFDLLFVTLRGTMMNSFMTMLLSSGAFVYRSRDLYEADCHLSIVERKPSSNEGEGEPPRVMLRCTIDAPAST